MKVGDFIRSKTSGRYGLILEVRKRVGVVDARVLWQGIACVNTWEFAEDLIPGVEDELVSFGGHW